MAIKCPMCGDTYISAEALRNHLWMTDACLTGLIDKICSIRK